MNDDDASRYSPRATAAIPVFACAIPISMSSRVPRAPSQHRERREERRRTDRCRRRTTRRGSTRCVADGDRARRRCRPRRSPGPPTDRGIRRRRSGSGGCRRRRPRSLDRGEVSSLRPDPPARRHGRSGWEADHQVVDVTSAPPAARQIVHHGAEADAQTDAADCHRHDRRVDHRRTRSARRPRAPPRRTDHRDDRYHSFIDAVPLHDGASP